MRVSLTLLGVSLGSLLGLAVPLRAIDPVIVHEWGTFTCLQDENGQAIKGINIDDEPVPPFVYQEAAVTVTDQYSQWKGNFGLPPYQNFWSKGWAPGDPEVTMRLETPVIYLYPPQGHAPSSVPPLQVHVDFHGGLLSQYYPYAEAEGLAHWGLGITQEKGILNGLTSGLTWKDVRLGSRETPVVSEDKVWTTPREVQAPILQVQAPGGWEGNKRLPDKPQAEHFLFYRGVGHLDSPLRLQDGDGSLGIWSPAWSAGVTCDHAWLADIQPDGSCAYRELPSFSGAGSWWRPVSMATMPLNFDPTTFSPGNLARLKASMQDALVKEGLYPDEASAMLRTWELSYFKSPGLRFFYIVPRAWVDKVLPLKITGAPTRITRVMVGRIELITAAQKAALARLGAGPCPDLATIKQSASEALERGKLTDEEKRVFYSGDKPLSELGVTIPPLVQDYLSLGRFRDALIVREQQQHPSTALAQFIEDNRLVSQQN
jgi:hypothetical protein